MEKWLGFFGWLFSVSTAVGNGFVIFLVAKKRRLHSSANWLVLSLAMADFLVGAVAYPLAYFCTSLGCNFKLYTPFFWFFVHSSVTNLCALTWNRYSYIVYPFSYKTSVTERRTKTVILSAWLVPFAIFLTLLVGSYIAKSNTALIVLRLTGVSAFDLISGALLLYAVVRIFRVARMQAYREFSVKLQVQSTQTFCVETSIPKHQRQNKAHFVIAIVILFFLCHLAVNGMILWVMFSTRVVHEAAQGVQLLLIINSAVNPFVYAFLKSDIRIEITKLITNHRSTQFLSSLSRTSSSPAHA